MKRPVLGLRTVLCGTFVAALLVACGGSDDSTPAATPIATASDDTATIDWNTTASLAVTANDTVANGTATVSIATAPLHGTAVADGVAIRYTPAAGYFGADALTYTLTVGGQTSVATVNLAVTAKLTLSGVISDGPLPGASVVANIGGIASAAVTADEAGAYTIAIESADPSAFVNVTATGAGVQSTVVLTSLVGEMAQAAAAAASGAVNATTLTGLNVTNVTTAVSALTAQAIGKLPGSASDVAAAQGLFAASQVLEMAAAIKLVADAGVALPIGTSDTLALVSDTVAYSAFVTAQAAQNADLFAQTQQAILTDSGSGFAPPTPTPTTGPLSYWVVRGQGAAASAGTRVVLQSDHSATVEDLGTRAATWSVAGNKLNITYVSPVTQTGGSDAEGSVYTSTSTGLSLRQLSGAPGSGPVAATFSGSTTITTTGGNVSTQDDTATYAFAIVKTPMDFTAEDFAIGTRWAGLLAASASWTEGAPDQDALLFTTATTANFEHSGQTVLYEVTGGKLVITFAGATFTYQRLSPGPRGEERWVGEKVQTGVSQAMYEMPAYRAQPTFAPFTTESLTHRWESYVNVGVVSSKSYIDLLADGSASGVTIDPDGTQTPFSSGRVWTIDGAGLMVMTNPTDPGSIPRTWELLGISDNRIFVLEYTGSYRLNVYTSQ